MNIQNTAWLLWAKLGNRDYRDGFHPLFCHLVDVGSVAGEILERRTSSQQRRWLADSLGLTESSLAPWGAFWVAAHDIGKAIPGFQFRDNTAFLREKMIPLGFENTFPDAPTRLALPPDGRATFVQLLKNSDNGRCTNGRGAQQ